jgi:transcriptional regulator with XRE-family HTH domain
VFVNKNFSQNCCVSQIKTVSPWLKKLGGNIRRERLGRDLTQQQLAELADLNIRNLQRIEAGEVDVLLTTALRLRKALGCSLDRLLPKD